MALTCKFKGAKNYIGCASPCTDLERGTVTKITKNIGFLSNPEKLQSYQASSQCLAIIGRPAKRHLNGVSLVGQ